MTSKKILVTVDFTELSEKVARQAAVIGSETGAGLVLLHVTEHTNQQEPALIRLKEITKALSEKYGVDCEGKVRSGSIFREIPAETEDNDYLLTLMGTHGIHGLKQKLLGADILKVITRIPVPVLVVQSTSQVRDSFKRIVMPVATHRAYEKILQAVVLIASLCKSEVHVYSIERPGFEWPESLKRNLDRTREIFEKNGISFVRVNEKQTVLSIGFASQTLQYARKTGADMLAIMSVSSEEYHYFAQQDKENLLTNQAGIPVLCASDTVRI